MIRHSVEERLFAIGLAAIAGFVDAVGFLELGGYFVSFMSGNTTRFGAGLASLSSEALIALALIVTFVGGVVVGTLIGRDVTARRPTILAFVTAILTVAAFLGAFDLPAVALFLVALAMGAKNTVFERDGEVAMGVTYMTGALVKVGQRLAVALRGGDRTGWVWYFALWAGLASGATIGATVQLHIGIAALWLAAAASALFLLFAVFVDAVHPRH